MSRRPRGHEERIAQPVDARDPGERVIDRRAERTQRDLDDLRDSELWVLAQQPVASEPDVLLDVDGSGGRVAVGLPDARQPLAAEDELSGPEGTRTIASTAMASDTRCA